MKLTPPAGQGTAKRGGENAKPDQRRLLGVDNPYLTGPLKFVRGKTVPWKKGPMASTGWAKHVTHVFRWKA